MRIVLATSSFAPYVGGVEEHVRNVAHILRSRGHEVVVWTVARDGRERRREHEGIAVHDLPAPLPARSFGALARFAVSGPIAVMRWIRAARRARPDLIHVHCFGPNGSYAWLLSKILRVPLVVSAHGETIADDNGMFDSSMIARRMLRAAIRDADAVTGCSVVALDDLRRRFGLAPERGIPVPNGIDLAEDSSTPVSGLPARYVAAVGRIQYLKGFDLLIEAFAHADLDPAVHLVIAGDGPQKQKLEALAALAGVSERVHFTGMLARSQVGYLMSRAAAIAVPSRFEAFGITALEAWRARRPLIVTSRGGPPEFATDGEDALVRDPMDTESLAAALETVLGDDALAEKLASSGHARVQALTWDHTVDLYEELYGRLGGTAVRRDGARARVAFLYASEPSKEFADAAAGRVPSHRVFGALDVPEDVEALWFSWPARWPRRWRSARVWRVVQAVKLLMARDVAATICTTEASAPPVLLLRALGLLRHDVVVVNVALLKSQNAHGPRRVVLGWLLRRAGGVASYARSQVPLIVERFGVNADRSRFVPLGVDTRYFSPTAPDGTRPEGDFLLFAGTNEGKDMTTLMAALDDDTSCVVVTDDGNIARGRAAGAPAGVVFRSHVPIAELRALYAGAHRIVLTLREGTASSGQTVLLENLAMGHRPIISDVSYIRDYVAGDVADLVPAGDAAALRRALAGPPRPLTDAEHRRLTDEFDVRATTDELSRFALRGRRGVARAGSSRDVDA